MANTFGFQGFASPEEVKAAEQQAFMQRMAAGDKNDRRAMTMLQSAQNLTGSAELRRAKEIQKVQQKAAEKVGGMPAADDLQAQRNYYAEAHRLAVEAGLADVAEQAQSSLVQLESINLERAKLRADTEATTTQTELARNRDARLSGENELLSKITALDAQIQKRPQDDPARQTLVNQRNKTRALLEDKRLEWEREKKWGLSHMDTLDDNGVPVRQYFRFNQINPDERRTIGKPVPLSVLAEAEAKGRGGKDGVSATVERLVRENQLSAMTSTETYRRNLVAIEAAKNLGTRGLAGAGRTAILNAFGAEDITELNKKLVQENLTLEGLRMLPPGPASDRDVKIALRTQLNEKSSEETIQRALIGKAKYAAYAAEYHNFIDNYVATKYATDGEATFLGAQQAWKAWAGENEGLLHQKVAKRLMEDTNLPYEMLFREEDRPKQPIQGTRPNSVATGSVLSVTEIP